MCSIWKRQKGYDDISIEKYKAIFSEELLSNNLEYINLTGGEPLLRNDLDDIVSMFIKLCKRMKVMTLATNGILSGKLINFCQTTIEALPSSVKYYVSLSLDGNEETHNKIRGYDQAFNKVMTSAEYLCEMVKKYENMELGFHATLSAYNFDQARYLYELAEDKGIGIGFVPAALVNAFIKSNGCSSEFCLTNNQKKEIAKFYAWLNDKWFSKYRGMIVDMLTNDTKRTMTCLARKQGVLLDVDGTVYPCGQSADMAFGNICKNTFTAIWYSKQAKEVRNKIKVECDRCMTDCYPAE